MIKQLFKAAFKKEYFKIKRIDLLGRFKTTPPPIFSFLRAAFLLIWVGKGSRHKITKLFD
jgi:hypothetical protein